MFHIRTSRIAATLVLLSTAALPQTVTAASYLDTIRKGQKTSYTATLAEIALEESGITTRTLDWRQPSIELFFDLPPSERTSEIILNLSADPLTRVAPNAPLQIQFNDGKPVPVLSNGRGFEARLPLDADKSRNKRNKIRISYPAPAGADCVSPAHGAWSIDLTQSTLRMGGRARSRNMNIAEVSSYLQQPALSPNTVGLIARGPHGTDMQALAAQAISLRTPDVPKFSVFPRGTDFNVIMVKRDRLFDFTTDPMILNSKGARIFVPRGRPTELIFTADTDAEIVEMLEIFSTRKLPKTNRSISSVGELDLQDRIDRETKTVEGKTRLLDLATSSSAGLTGSQTYKFNIDEPAATGGELLLRLATTKGLTENSRLRVVLNGKTLGAAKLNQTRKSVAFDIQPGELNATANVLILMPDLQADAGFSCPKIDSTDSGYSVGFKSSLSLKKQVASSVTELSQLTAAGGLFSKAESYIALPAQTRDYQAALRVLGRIAKSTGHGLTSADYSRKAIPEKDKHVLIIGPSNMVKDHMTGAPKALRDAMSGRSSAGDNLLQAAYERSASLGFDDAVLKYAAAKSAPRKIWRGGVAALYDGGNGNLTGVISSAPGSSFTTASEALIQPDHWNALKGGVARWTRSSVVMAQTAQSDAKITQPDSKAKFSLPEIGVYAIDYWDLYWPDINWPEFDVPQVDWPAVKLPSFKFVENILSSREKTQASEDLDAVSLRQSIPPIDGLKTVEVTPRLKPNILNKVIRPSSKKVGLRGPFEFSIDKPKSLRSLQDLRRGISAKWSETKTWFNTQIDNVSALRNNENIAKGTDRSHVRVGPTNEAIKSTLKDKLPGKGLVQIGDRTVSLYALLLLFAFGFILLLMSLARPVSRKGERQ